MDKIAWFTLAIYLWGVAASLDLYWHVIKRQKFGELLVFALLSWSGVAWTVAIAVLEESGCD